MNGIAMRAIPFREIARSILIFIYFSVFLSAGAQGSPAPSALAKTRFGKIKSLSMHVSTLVTSAVLGQMQAIEYDKISEYGPDGKLDRLTLSFQSPYKCVTVIEGSKLSIKSLNGSVNVIKNLNLQISDLVSSPWASNPNPGDPQLWKSISRGGSLPSRSGIQTIQVPAGEEGRSELLEDFDRHCILTWKKFDKNSRLLSATEYGNFLNVSGEIMATKIVTTVEHVNSSDATVSGIEKMVETTTYSNIKTSLASERQAPASGDLP